MSTVAVVRSSPGLDRAYSASARLARGHYENFPVASILLPKHMRPGIAAIYAFARRADDFADEPGYADDERLRLLDDWQRRLRDCLVVTPPSQSPEDLVFVALADTIRTHQLPVSLFEDLLSAFRQDVTVKRYRRWEDVLDYCSRSANPIGRLVLRVGGYSDPALDSASDALCTALQLTNFWQDFAEDWTRGRLYVPLDDRDRASARDADLDDGLMTPQWRVALGVVAARTRDLFAVGRPVCDGVTGRLKLELRVTWLGGSRILDRLDAAEYDVFRRKPSLSLGDVVPLFWRALTWKAA